MRVHAGDTQFFPCGHFKNASPRRNGGGGIAIRFDSHLWSEGLHAWDVYDVSPNHQSLAAGRDHVAGVTRRVAGKGNSSDAGKNLALGIAAAVVIRLDLLAPDQEKFAQSNGSSLRQRVALAKAFKSLLQQNLPEADIETSSRNVCFSYLRLARPTDFDQRTTRYLMVYFLIAP